LTFETNLLARKLLSEPPATTTRERGMPILLREEDIISTTILPRPRPALVLVDDEAEMGARDKTVAMDVSDYREKLEKRQTGKEAVPSALELSLRREVSRLRGRVMELERSLTATSGQRSLELEELSLKLDLQQQETEALEATLFKTRELLRASEDGRRDAELAVEALTLRLLHKKR
jgi:hypothetical protein